MLFREDGKFILYVLQQKNAPRGSVFCTEAWLSLLRLTISIGFAFAFIQFR